MGRHCYEPLADRDGAWSVSGCRMAVTPICFCQISCCTQHSTAGRAARYQPTPHSFLILTIGASAASLALALGVRLLFQTAGNSDADANAAMLLLLPVLWAILTFVLLILTSRKQQFGVLAACLACVIPALG